MTARAPSANAEPGAFTHPPRRVAWANRKESDMKHTPGPWTAGGTTVYGGSGARTTIASTACCGSLTREEDEANARLIAAAPDLAAVLRAYASLRKRWQDDDEFGTVDFLDALGDLQPQIVAALAKLEGGDK